MPFKTARGRGKWQAHNHFRGLLEAWGTLVCPGAFEEQQCRNVLADDHGREWLWELPWVVVEVKENVYNLYCPDCAKNIEVEEVHEWLRY